MAIQLYIGLVTEGETDNRFLRSVIERLFTEIANDCHSDIIIEAIYSINMKKEAFTSMMLKASKYAYAQCGASILCIHADSDSRTLHNVYSYKINPFLDELNDYPDEEYCKAVIPIVPIQMIESWMLADNNLLKERINAVQYTNDDLGLHRAPEAYANPKQAIENAISFVRNNRPKKRRYEIDIADLYGELGSIIELDKLRELPSFQNFETNARQIFRDLHYLL